MSDTTIADDISSFLIRIRDRRFDEESLRILELFWVAKDLKSLSEVRSVLRGIMRSELILIFSEIGGESVAQNLTALEFFARAFALVGDMESCLAMIYEGLTLRELMSPSCELLSVSHAEWLSFAEQSIENGFASIARKACENALSCLKKDRLVDSKSEECTEIIDATKKACRLLDSAASLKSSHSVQAQAAEYLKRKELRNHNRQPPLVKKEECLGSTLFREGIKKRNERMLQDLRNIQITPKTYPHK